MTELLNKKEFVKLLAEEMGVTQKEATAAYDGFTATLDKAIRTGKRVLVGDNLRLQATITPAGKARNPKTKEMIDRPEKGKLQVKVSPNWQEALLEGGKKNPKKPKPKKA